MSLSIQRCTHCGHAHFPEALLCFSCGGGSFAPTVVEGGTVVSSTDIAYQVGAGSDEPVWLAVVEVQPRAFVVARLRKSADEGERVSLDVDGQIIWASP